MSASAIASVSNAALLERRRAAVSAGVASSTAVYADRALNSEVWDVEGRRYVDFAGGIAVLNVGHRHPRVMAAVQDQLGRFTHTAFQVLAYEPYVALAERLNALAPIEGAAKTIFFTSGAEAVENAVKIARAATGRPGVIAFTGGFHGRTTLSSALTGKVAPYKRMFGGAPANIFHAPFPIAAHGVSVEDSLRALDFLFAADLHPSSVAAIIVEPVQGEGGFHPAPDALMSALRVICDAHGILLIADEVQTGFGRTGKMFGAEHWSVRPDLITVAKSLAGGFPLSGVIGRAALMDFVEPGGLGGTYGGAPIACAAALAVLDVLEDEALCARADTIGVRLRERIAGFEGRNDLVPTRGLRGPGAMIAFDVLTADGRPDGASAKAVAGRALERGLILLTCGVSGETVRILAPLTIPFEQLDEGLDILEDSLRLDVA
ncbi:4-aminobutyrate--2-oxoglutarate transaminase [Caulobacter sp. RHG1]|uniref:4-aminobutyrate--2-oxoglutarate transaminase n=1 Tax=Caulobacter sp. (strain RHG1) TaxID=2545762 RepID=UPI0018858DEB|nr:4-aminobutyrate--2-oxoglutarate transaminase [Caulobacter sp. RHG1]NQE62800.1 Gamma-aminobutyrate:alpha-ketoglutarate aminotransferase [Caulobacter sp. RHG1]